MDELIEALAAHLEWESEPLQVRTPGGSWDDVERLVTPLAAAWTSIGALANGAAFDPDQTDAATEFERGRSQLAHEILRRMAAAEHAVQDRNA